jgi:hypothetical protein
MRGTYAIVGYLARGGPGKLGNVVGGLDREALAEVHDLKAADRECVEVSPAAISAVEQAVEASVTDLRQRNVRASPGRPCRRCDVHSLSRWDVK